ncbi:MAG: hypothetical protein AMXMBFR59_29660 [Rhodanobacteraceae bacterium]
MYAPHMLAIEQLERADVAAHRAPDQGAVIGSGRRRLRQGVTHGDAGSIHGAGLDAGIAGGV